MAAIPDHEELVSYDSTGKPVCFKHHLRVCGVCKVDFKFEESDSEYDSALELELEDDDRVFMLVGGLARFMPQCDEEVKGPANVAKHNRNEPPKPATPDRLEFHYCDECELTWLVGREGPEAAQGHPSHHTLYHMFVGTTRSLVVFIDGACPSNGSHATAISIGAHFGPESMHNISRVIKGTKNTSQIAEITAAIEAMRHTREVVVPTRQKILQTAAQEKSAHVIRSIAHFRLILATDSSYVVECVCKHMSAWTLNESSRTFKNRKGEAVENSKYLVTLWEEMELLSRVGVQVTWYHVPREFNAQAHKLATPTLVEETSFMS